MMNSRFSMPMPIINNSEISRFSGGISHHNDFSLFCNALQAVISRVEE